MWGLALIFSPLGTVAGGSNVALTLQWNATDEGAGFDRVHAGMAHFNGAAWKGVGGTLADRHGGQLMRAAFYDRPGSVVQEPVGMLSRGIYVLEIPGSNGTKRVLPFMKK